MTNAPVRIGTALQLPVASPSRSPQLAEARAELVRLAKQRPQSAGPCRLLGKLLSRLYQEAPTEAPPVLASAEVAAKLRAGLPLLRGVSMQLDRRSFDRRWLGICEAVERERRDDAAERLASAYRRRQLDPAQLTQDLLRGRPEAVRALADALDLDPGLMAVVLRLTLFPVLASFDSLLAPLRAEIPWGLGFCPTCGSPPLLGELRGQENMRFLRCGLCAAAWEFSRFQCPYCGNCDQRESAYFLDEGVETEYRTATCHACLGYVKIVSTPGGLSPPCLLVADLATMHLDLAAGDHGYSVQP